MKKLFPVLLMCLWLGACAQPVPEPSPTPVPTVEPTPEPTALPIAKDEYVLVNVNFVDTDDGSMVSGMLNRMGGLTSFATEVDNITFEEGFDQLEVGQVVTVHASGVRMSSPGSLTDVTEVHVLRQADEGQIERAMAVYDGWRNNEW